MQKSLKLIKSL